MAQGNQTYILIRSYLVSISIKTGWAIFDLTDYSEAWIPMLAKLYRIYYDMLCSLQMLKFSTSLIKHDLL